MNWLKTNVTPVHPLNCLAGVRLFANAHIDLLYIQIGQVYSSVGQQVTAQKCDRNIADRLQDHGDWDWMKSIVITNNEWFKSTQNAILFCKQKKMFLIDSKSSARIRFQMQHAHNKRHLTLFLISKTNLTNLKTKTRKFQIEQRNFTKCKFCLELKFADRVNCIPIEMNRCSECNSVNKQ